jgi:hypothetical protein
VSSLGHPDGSFWLPAANDDDPLLSVTVRLPLSLLALPLTMVLPLLSTHLPDPVSLPTLPLQLAPLLSVMTPVAPLLSILPEATVSPLLSTHVPVVVSPTLAVQVLPLLSRIVTFLPLMSTLPCVADLIPCSRPFFAMFPQPAPLSTRRAMPPTATVERNERIVPVLSSPTNGSRGTPDGPPPGPEILDHAPRRLHDAAAAAGLVRW